jgi:hypothetical protein
MAKTKVPETPIAGQQISLKSPSRWSTAEVSEILWLAVALRDKRDERAERFWAAVQCLSLTSHPIERRRLRRVAKVTFRREYGRVLKAVA